MDQVNETVNRFSRLLLENHEAEMFIIALHACLYLPAVIYILSIQYLV